MNNKDYFTHYIKLDKPLHPSQCILGESIKECGKIINKPVTCGQCGNTHK